MTPASRDVDGNTTPADAEPVLAFAAATSVVSSDVVGVTAHVYCVPGPNVMAAEASIVSASHGPRLSRATNSVTPDAAPITTGGVGTRPGAVMTALRLAPAVSACRAEVTTVSVVASTTDTDVVPGAVP